MQTRSLPSSMSEHIGLQQSPAVQTSDAQVIGVVRSLFMPAMVPPCIRWQAILAFEVKGAGKNLNSIIEKGKTVRTQSNAVVHVAGVAQQSAERQVPLAQTTARSDLRTVPALSAQVGCAVSAEYRIDVRYPADPGKASGPSSPGPSPSAWERTDRGVSRQRVTHGALHG